MTICEDPLAKVFGGGEVGVDAEGVGEGRHAKLFREGPPKKRCFGGGDVGHYSFIEYRLACKSFGSQKDTVFLLAAKDG